MRIEFAMWANVQAFCSAFIILAGGILGISIKFRLQEIAIFAIIVGVFIIFFEYPRSKRGKGSNTPRPGQEHIAPIINFLGPVGRNYFVRFIVYLCMCIPMFFLLPTMLGGICLFCSCTSYFIAALLGEQWRPISLAWGPGSQVTLQVKRVATSEAPTAAPPRAPMHARYNNSSTADLVEMERAEG